MTKIKKYWWYNGWRNKKFNWFD